MNTRSLLTILCLTILLFLLPTSSCPAQERNFGMNWQFAVDLPQVGISAILKGHLEHLRKTDFWFSGNFISRKGQFKSGPISVKTLLSLGEGTVRLRKLSIRIKHLGIKLPELGLADPDIEVSGQGLIRLIDGSASFKDLSIQAGSLPTIKTDLHYVPDDNGSATLTINNPLPLFEKLAENYYQDFKKWDKNGDFNLQLSVRQCNSAPEATLQLGFNSLSAASPDGSFLVDGLSGSIHSVFPINAPRINAQLALNSGEALFDTFYVNLNKHPLKASFSSTLPDKNAKMSARVKMHWNDIGTLTAKGVVKDIHKAPSWKGKANIMLPEFKTPFNLFAVEPFSLENITADGQLTLACNIIGSLQNNFLNGKIEFQNGTLESGKIKISGINSALPFAIMLDNHFIPRADESLQEPPPGNISIKNSCGSHQTG